MREQPQSSDSNIVVGTPVIAATVVNLDLISDLTEDQSVVILLRMNDLRVSDLVSITVMLVLTAWRIIFLSDSTWFVLYDTHRTRQSLGPDVCHMTLRSFAGRPRIVELKSMVMSLPALAII